MEGGTGVQISPPRVRRVAGAGKDGDAVPIQTRASVEDIVPPASLSVPTASHAEVRRGLDQVWRKTRGPIFATVSVAAAYLLTRTSIPIPDLAPVYLVVVVGIAAVDGSRSGTASGLIMVAYVAYADSSPSHLFTYTRDNLLHLGIFSTATLAAALLAGAPARRTNLLRSELLAQGQRLSEAVKAKREFMSAAAHELRTPLTVIAGYVSMLQDETFGRLPERFRDPISAMQRKAREVATLIDEMLLAARVRSGTAPIAPMPVDVRDAVREAVERAEPRVTLEQATLSYEVPSATVAAEVDPGWGVPEAMRQKIFEGFVHYANPEYKPKSGRVLGLSISRDLAERYGGSLDLVGTEPGKGSIFVLRLPVAS